MESGLGIAARERSRSERRVVGAVGVHEFMLARGGSGEREMIVEVNESTLDVKRSAASARPCAVH